ncbi:MAG: cyclic peptide export ABC transporter [Gammaproteobacteria bacterium]
MFLFLWRSSRFLFLFALIAGLASGLSSAALIAMVNAALSESYDLGLFVLPFSALGVVALLSRFLSHHLINRINAKTLCELRVNICRMILAAPFPYLQKRGKAALLAHLTEDIATMAAACQLLPVVYFNATVVIGCMAYLAWLSWQLALILAGIILFGVGSFILMRAIPRSAMARAREEYDDLSRSFRALTEGVKELKLHRHRAEDFMTHGLTASAKKHSRFSLSGMTAYLWVSQWANLLYYVTIASILCLFPIIDGVGQDVVRGYALVFLYMMSPLTVLTTSMPAMGRAKVALDQVNRLGLDLTSQTPVNDLPSVPEWSEFRGISMRGVRHRFHREKENRSFTLGPIDLNFEPGELVFLVGGNGSGKTTLAMLLLGLYEPESGEICLNGIPVAETNRNAYLQTFSAVFSDFYLFDALFGFDADKITPQVLGFLERLNLHSKVAVDNGRFSSVDLSQGQRKRLALLIAYLEDRPFYVFDEWAADQDPEFKHVFYTELLPALTAKGKTVLAITHDDRYFYLADRCIKMEEGQIVAIETRQRRVADMTRRMAEAAAAG